jgi:hypothetical protein
MDVAVTDFDSADCRILHYGIPNPDLDIVPGSPEHREYTRDGQVLRWYLGLMGETSPVVSPLSVDIAGDKDYRVYRYDWVFGVALPNLSGTNRGELWWDWQKRLADATSVSVQMILSPAAGMGYTCVAAKLNVLPPSRDTKTWWQKNRGDVYEVVKAGTRTAEEIYPGTITKVVASLSNSLDAQTKWRTTNWFIYQFLDSTTQACAVEWRITKKILNQYGPLLRGSLILAFHGGADERKGIRLELRPQLGFNPHDELSRVSPTFKLEQDQQVKLDILPRAAEGSA